MVRLIVNSPKRNRMLSLASALCLAACASGNYAPVVYHQFGSTGDTIAQDGSSSAPITSSGDPSMRTAGLAPVQSEPLGITGATLPPPSGAASSEPIEAEQPHGIVPPLSQSAELSPVPQAQTTTEAPQSQAPQVTAETSAPASDAGPQTVIVKSGETLFAIGRNYHVSRQAVIDANNLKPPYDFKIGTRLIIPGDDTTSTASAQPAPAPAPSQALVQQSVASSAPVSASSSITSEASNTARAPAGKVHIVMPGETVASISREEHVRFSEIIKVNNLSSPNQIKVGQKLRLDAGAPAEIAEIETEAKQAQVADAKPEVLHPAKAEGGPLLHVGEAPVPPASAKVAPEQHASIASPSKHSFIWPVSGRILSAFGPKDAGRRNDGVNIAAPIGTAVRATRAGEVIYVGNELRGYGNLILIRHDDGYVSAYAHNSRILVKRGAFVQQGQEIAESGETGSVACLKYISRSARTASRSIRWTYCPRPDPRPFEHPGGLLPPELCELARARGCRRAIVRACLNAVIPSPEILG